MIIEGGSRRGAKWFAGHVMRQDAGQQVRIVEARGLAGWDISGWFRQMEAVSFGTRCENYFYHANINPREDESLTQAQRDEAVDKLEQNLGLDGHARFIVEHEKNGRTHWHVFWSRIDPETMTAVSDSKNYRIHEKTADELEKAFGHRPTPRAHDVAERNPENWEVFRGKRSGIDPYDVGAELTDLWQQSDTGQSFAAALDAHGYILAEGRRGLCVVDQAGKEHSLARRVDGARKKDVDARMASVDRSALPTVEKARAMARERIAGRKEAEQQPTGFNPDPQAAPVSKPAKHGPSPFGELAEELVHAVKNGMQGKESELAAESAAETATPFEKLARNLAQGAKEAGPLAGELALAAAVVEGEHLAKEALSGAEAPARLREDQRPEPATPFERVTKDMANAWREAGGDEHWMKDAEFDWLAQRIRWPSSGAPPATREQTPFERATEDLAQATRENGGEPCSSDGQSFWQRARTLLATAHERVASWAKDTLQSFVDKLKRERSAARDEQGLER